MKSRFVSRVSLLSHVSVCAGAGVREAECSAAECWVGEGQWRTGENWTEQRKTPAARIHTGGQVVFFNALLLWPHSPTNDQM